MKTLKISLLLSAATLLFSCSKQDTFSSGDNADVKMVSKTFVLESEEELRTAVSGIQDKKLSIAWSEGDRISVYSNVAVNDSYYLGTYTIQNGAITCSFPETAARIYMLYPAGDATSFVCNYTDDDNDASTLAVNVPTTQTAVDGSYQVDAYPSIAYGNPMADAFIFQTVGGLLKFRFTDSDIRAITFSGNNGEKVAGKATVTNVRAKHQNVSEAETTVTLKATDVFATGTDYYLPVLRVPSYANGFSLIVTKSGGAKYRKSVSTGGLETRNGQWVDMGSITTADHAQKIFRYDDYMAGNDLVINGTLYNKSVNGDAVLVSDASTLETAIAEGKIIFMDDDITLSGTPGAAGTVVIASNSLENQATLSVASKSQYIRLLNCSLALYDIAVNASGFLFSTKSNKTTDLVVKDCTIRMGANVTNFIISGGESNCIKNLVFDGNRILLSGASNNNLNFIHLSQNKVLGAFKTFRFTNNVFCSAVNSDYVSSLYNVTDNIAEQTYSGTYDCIYTVDHNIFYNTPFRNTLLKTYQVSNIALTKNIFVAREPVETARHFTFVCKSADQTADAFDMDIIRFSNIVYSPDTFLWNVMATMANPDINEPYTGRANQFNGGNKTPSNPFLSFDTSTGSYTLDSAYADYGPQN